MTKRIVVGDLEANGLLNQATHVWCGVFKDIRTKKVWKFAPDEIPQMLAFMDTCHVMIIHNGIGYDWPLLRKLYGYEYKGKKVDTLLMSRLQDENRRLPYGCPTMHNGRRVGPHSLLAWGYRVGRGKVDHEDWDNYSSEMLHRCSEDVEIGELVYNALMEEGSPYNWIDAHKLTFRLFEILQQQEEYGWLVDKPYMERCVQFLTRFMDKIDRAVTPLLPYVCEIQETKVKGVVNYVKKPFLASGQYSQSVKTWFLNNNLEESTRIVSGPFTRLSFRKVNLGSGDEVKDYLLGLGWVPEHWNTNSEGARTSPKLSVDEPFYGLTSRVGRLIAKRIQIRHRRSQIEGWLERVRPDGRIGSRVTGLASTGRAKHADIVNVPGAEAFFGKQMRKCFICKEGFKIVGTDSAGCQNRMLAARVKDPFFTETLINGTKEDKTSIHWVNVKAIKDIAGYDVSYGTAKGLNYAFMFGASDNKLGLMVGKGKEAGAEIRKALLSVSAGFEALVASLTEEWRGNAKKRKRTIQTRWGDKVVDEFYDGWVVGLDGRPIFIASEHAILVYVLQSDEAIMMSAAYCMLYKRATAKGWVHGADWGLLIWYHDEFQAEVREDIAEEFAEIANSCIVDAGKYFKIDCPHEGESAVGNNWKETH